jgi:uncharacterized protein YndB with AHSA1/START domain
MPVTNAITDAAARTMTMTAEFDAPLPRVWELFGDPRRLEQWWTPPEMPLTVTDHDLSVGGWVRAYVTPPEGEKVHAYWRIIAVDAPHSMEWEDGFLGADGEPSPDIPAARMKVALADRAAGGTVMTILASFSSAETMQWYLDMDLAENFADQIGRADALLAG